MTIFQSAVYGVVQGLTEFLPVSSSAHLVLIPFFFRWEDPGLAFDVALHWGTLIAVVIYFRETVKLMFVRFFESLKGGRTPEHQLPWKIIAATIPGGVIGFLFEKHAEETFRSPMILVFTLSIMGIALWGSDLWGSKKTKLEDLSWGKAILIGIGQGFAIIPGVSRSGVTITLGLLLGLEREAAVRFSFLLAMPIIFGAGVLKSKYLIHNIADPVVLTGLTLSFLSGIAAIHFLMTYIRKKTFGVFAAYRIMLAAIIMIVLMTR